jgi:hypothetical protein
MLGMLGVIVANNKLSNTVQIIEEIDKGKRYLVKFCNEPVFNRVCQVEEVQSWLLFQNQEELNTWIQKTAGAPPPGKEDGGKAGAKKPEGKQSGTRRRSPANKKDQ